MIFITLWYLCEYNQITIWSVRKSTAYFISHISQELSDYIMLSFISDLSVLFWIWLYFWCFIFISHFSYGILFCENHLLVFVKVRIYRTWHLFGDCFWVNVTVFTVKVIFLTLLYHLIDFWSLITLLVVFCFWFWIIIVWSYDYFRSVFRSRTALLTHFSSNIEL